MGDKLTIVVGGQAGSEGKGAVTARLHKEQSYGFAVRIGGPNAGHTVVDKTGFRFPLRQVPVAAVADPKCRLVIAAGSEVDPEVLDSEIRMLEEHGHRVRNRLFVDPRATWLESHWAEGEKQITTGTTGKGIGAVRAARAMREARLVLDIPKVEQRWGLVDTGAMLRRALASGARVMIEGTQGHVLGSHAGYYPHCTSGDCRAIDFMAACGLPPSEADVWVVLRTYPIRIAGGSGPLPNETSWEELQIPVEYTTVTKKPRRVAEWNWEWADASMDANSAPGRRAKVALTFADYWWPELSFLDGPIKRDQLPEKTRAKLYAMEVRLNADIRMLGTGPSTQVLLDPEGEDNGG